MYIDDLNLSGRTKNSLKRAGIFETSQLLSVSIDTLSKTRGFGNQALEEVSAAIEKLKQEASGEVTIAPAAPSVNDKDSLIRLLCHIPDNLITLFTSFSK